jgi:hypothetical protein
MIKLSSDYNDFKIAHLANFFQSGDLFLINQRAYTSYHIVIVVQCDLGLSAFVVQLTKLPVRFR